MNPAHPARMNKQQRMAAWAAKKAAGVRQQIDALPQATDWRSRQRIAQTADRLRREEARLLGMAERYADAA